MRVVVPLFPHSRGDYAALRACEHLGWQARTLWFQEGQLPAGTQLVILPDAPPEAGWAGADALRLALDAFIHGGGLVLGTGDGLRALCQGGWLPGQMEPNPTGRYHHGPVTCRVERSSTAFTSTLKPGRVLALPVAQGQGAFSLESEALVELELQGGVVLRACGPGGEISEAYNPFGSKNNIAGLSNAQGTVMGLIAHPERALGHPGEPGDGMHFFQALA